MRPRSPSVPWFAACALACSSPSATVAVTTGGDPGTLTMAPAVVSLELDAVDQTGARATLATVTLPATTPIDLGTPSSSLVASLELTGKDAAGDAVVFGATPFVELGALDGATVPLFVQRRAALAAMPGATTDARTGPLLATAGRAIYWVGGSLAGVTAPLNLGGYDLLALDQIGAQCGTSVQATSFALVTLTEPTSDGDYAYAALLDASSGSLSYIGLPGCTDATVSPTKTNPLPFADVQGGQTILGDDGTAYVVGPSRQSAASGSILALHPDGSMAAFTTTARAGAATAWAPGRGLFLYGGGGGAAVITSAGAELSTANYASDPATGLAAVAFDSTKTMLVLEGQALSTVDLSLDCPSNAPCTPAPFGQPLPAALTSPSLFALGDGAFAIVGDDPSGATHLVRADSSSSVDVPLKIPRHGARAIQTTAGAIVLVGGGSATPESYVD